MPDTTEVELAKVTAEVAGLQAEIEKERSWLTQYGDPDFDTTMRQKFGPQFLKLDVLTRKLNEARQRQLALQLTLLNESTTKLNESAEKQLMSSQRLEKSSRKLETFSYALLMVTIVLALVGTGAYLLQLNIEKGLSGTTLLNWTVADTLLLVGVAVIAVVLLLRRAEKGVS